MTEKGILVAAVGVLFLIANCCVMLFAQQKTTTDVQQTKLTSLAKVINAEGWTIPAYEASVIKQTGTFRYRDLMVVQKLYELNDLLFTRINLYYLDSNNFLHLSTASGAVSSLVTYEFNGKAFMYRVPYTYGEKGALVGLQTIFYYVDEDGDGKFETRYQNPTQEQLPQIPDWVKRSQN